MSVRSEALLPDVQAFAASMPQSYRAAYGPEQMRAHADAVAKRKAGALHVEACTFDAGAPVCLCVIADESPGLLPRISAATVAHDIDIVSADVFRRQNANGRTEVIDVLQVRRASDPSRPLDDGIGEAVAGTLLRLIDEEAELDNVQAPPSMRPPPPGGYDVSFRFDDDESEGKTTLTVEAMDSPGLLLVVTRALFRAGLQIVGLRATTREGRAAEQIEIAELDGTPVRGARRFELQTALLSAIENARAST